MFANANAAEAYRPATLSGTWLLPSRAASCCSNSRSAERTLPILGRAETAVEQTTSEAFVEGLHTGF